MDDAAICYECIAHELRCRLLVDGNAAVKVLCTGRISTARYLSIRKPDVIRKVHDLLIAFQWIPDGNPSSYCTAWMLRSVISKLQGLLYFFRNDVSYAKP